MEFRRLIKSDLDSYFANRLRALELAPSAFLTTLAEERARGTTHFENTLSYTGDDKIIFGALMNDTVVGTIGIFRQDRPKTNHKAMIWGMYVDVAYRGKGLGGKLLDLAIDHAKNRLNSTTIYLSVESANSAARKLYESRAFKCWGSEPKAMGLDGRFWDEDHMVLEIGHHELASVSEFPQPRLETDRLILEPYAEGDIDDVFAYASNPEVTKMLTWPPHKTLEDSKKFLRWVRTTTNHRPGNLFFVFAIRLKSSGRVIGSIDFKNPQPWIGQVDYALSREHWGKGLMPEAAKELRDWALRAFPDMIRFQAYCQAENLASARVMQKIGLTFEGVRRRTLEVQGKIVDLAHYALIRND